MMGERRVMQEALFYGFSLERARPGQSPCFARSTVLWTFRRSGGGIWFRLHMLARRVVLRSIPS